MSFFGLFKSRREKYIEERKKFFLSAKVKFSNGKDYLSHYWENLLLIPRPLMPLIDGLMPECLPTVVVALLFCDEDIQKKMAKICAIQTGLPKEHATLEAAYLESGKILAQIIKAYAPDATTEKEVSFLVICLLTNFQNRKFLYVDQNSMGKLALYVDDLFYRGIFKGDFGIRISPCEFAASNGYVFMKHGSKYKIILFNDAPMVAAKAEVFIDKISIGSFVIQPLSSVSIEHPIHDNGCFTYYEYGTNEGFHAGIKEGMGYITCRFYKDAIDRQIYEEPKFSIAEGGTGLSDVSTQKIEKTENIKTDCKYTEINIRLISQRNIPKKLSPNK